MSIRCNNFLVKNIKQFKIFAERNDLRIIENNNTNFISIRPADNLDNWPTSVVRNIYVKVEIFLSGVDDIKAGFSIKDDEMDSLNHNNQEWIKWRLRESGVTVDDASSIYISEVDSGYSDYEDINLADGISAHIVPGHVCIVIGEDYSLAVSSCGECAIQLSDIYILARKSWPGYNITRAEL